MSWDDIRLLSNLVGFITDGIIPSSLNAMIHHLIALSAHEQQLNLITVIQGASPTTWVVSAARALSRDVRAVLRGEARERAAQQTSERTLVCPDRYGCHMSFLICTLEDCN